MLHQKWFFAVLVLMTLVGCRTVNTVKPEEDRSNPTTVNEEQIITDSSLEDEAEVVEVRETRVSNGLLKVQAQLKNRDTSKRRVNYRFDWLNKDGMVVDSPTSTWSQEVLQGKEAVWVSGVAPNSNVNNFRLKLIEPDN